MLKDTSEFIKFDQDQNTNISSNAQSSISPVFNSVAGSNVNKKCYYSFQWNSEPSSILCIFPYVIGFANQSIEIRLLVNGSLVNSITMSNIKLIASKV